MNAKSQQVLYCPHCGNKSIQTTLLEQQYKEIVYVGPEAQEETFDATYTVTRCESCNRLLVYTACEEFADETPLGDLVYPKQPLFSRDVPENVRRIHAEAARVKHVSPLAYVILARRVLEEICQVKGVNKPNLSQALSELASQGVIPKTLAEATTLIRLVGNAGAHASDMKITVPQVWAVENLIEALIEYLFVAPSRIEGFKQSLDHAKSTEKS